MKPLLALLCATVTIGVTGVAHADPDPAGAPDPTSAAFLDSLHAAGITYNRADMAITTAESVCKLVASGKSAPEVLATLKSSNPGLAPEHARQFLAIALRSYCPDRLVPDNPGKAG